MSTAVEAPDKRDLGSELNATTRAQVRNMPSVFAAESKFRPMYADLSNRVLGRTLFGSGSDPGTIDIMGRAQGQLDDIYGASTDRQREADIAAVERYGGRATSAFEAANPRQKALLDAMNSRAMQAGELTPYESTLSQQLLNDIMMGSRLDNSSRDEISNSVNSEWAKRGMAYSPAAAATVANITGQQGRALYQQRLNNAMGFLPTLQNRTSLGNQAMFQTAAVNSANATDPWLSILGRPSMNANAASQAMGNAYQMSSNSGPRLFDPYNDAGINAFNTNMEYSSRQATANNRAALYAAGIEAAGSVAGAAVKCWVAREIYGADNPAWLVFREWLENHAPRWFHDFYCRFGERFAAWIHDKPRVRTAIKPFFDARVCWMIENHGDTCIA